MYPLQTVLSGGFNLYLILSVLKNSRRNILYSSRIAFMLETNVCIAVQPTFVTRMCVEQKVL